MGENSWRNWGTVGEMGESPCLRNHITKNFKLYVYIHIKVNRTMLFTQKLCINNMLETAINEEGQALCLELNHCL